MIWCRTPSAQLVETFRHLDPSRFLVGPGRDPDEADIDPVFHKGLPAAIGDFQADMTRFLPYAALLDFADWAPKQVFDAEVVAENDSLQLTLEQTDTGVILLEHQDDLVCIRGLFTGPTLAVDEDYRGFGLGRDLVAARLLVEEELPLWRHGTPAYTPAGAVTVRSGCALVKTLCELALESEFTM